MNRAYFEEWAELEPSRCVIDPIYGPLVWCEEIDKAWLTPDGSVLEIVLDEAIKNKGGDWTTGMYSRSGYWADVSLPRIRMDSRDQKSVVEALLAAYVGGIKVTAALEDLDEKVRAVHNESQQD